jgi:hypothetical protein
VLREWQTIAFPSLNVVDAEIEHEHAARSAASVCLTNKGGHDRSTSVCGDLKSDFVRMIHAALKRVDVAYVSGELAVAHLASGALMS